MAAAATARAYSTTIGSQALSATTCVCGAEKSVGKPFCQGCYWYVPKELHAGLRRPAGKGFEQAYAAAQRILERIFR